MKWSCARGLSLKEILVIPLSRSISLSNVSIYMKYRYLETRIAIEYLGTGGMRGRRKYDTCKYRKMEQCALSSRWTMSIVFVTIYLCSRRYYSPLPPSENWSSFELKIQLATVYLQIHVHNPDEIIFLKRNKFYLFTFLHYFVLYHFCLLALPIAPPHVAPCHSRDP